MAGLAVVVYVTFAVAGRGSEQGEIFPFFSFNLFSKVPEQRVRASIYLHAVDDRPLAAPLPLLGSGYERGQHGVVVSQLANELLTSLRNDPAATDRLANALETNHLPDDTVWSLSLEHFNPLERWRNGDYDLTDVSWFSTKGEPPYPFALERARGRLQVEDRLLPMRPAAGRVEHVVERNGRSHLSGWAGDSETGSLPKQLVVFVDGQFAALGGIGVSRPDIAAATGQPGLLASGFSFFLPPDVSAGDVEVVAVFDDGAGLIPR